jgi:hypothetical protein
MVEARNPGHAHFFFYTEHFERFTTHKHARQGSDNAVLDKLYFVPVILAGSLPWLGACLSGLGRALAFLRPSRGPFLPEAAFARWAVATLLAAFAWPLLFFSLSGSKLVPYVMPCIVPLMALAAAFGTDGGRALPIKRAGTELLAFGGLCLLAAAIVLLPPWAWAEWADDLRGSGGGPWLLFLGLAFSLLGAWGVRAKGPSVPTPQRWMAWNCALLLLLSVAAHRVNGPNSTIDGLVASAPRGNVQWISHGEYFQALPFLTKGRVTVVGGTGELAFGRDRLDPAERGRWFIEDRMALTETALRLRRETPGLQVWAVSGKRAWAGLPPQSRAAWVVVDAQSSPRAVLLRLAGSE